MSEFRLTYLAFSRCSLDSTNDAAQLKKEKYEKLLDEHYTRAKSTVWSGWYDSEIRDWLVQHGYLKSDAQAKRDEVSGQGDQYKCVDLDQLVSTISNKYKETTSAPYLAWPDARLRAQLRSYGVDDTKYTTRPSLIHEVRSMFPFHCCVVALLTLSPIRPEPQHG